MSALVEVGRYERRLDAALPRLIENALDWEHLPHLHDDSFRAIKVKEAGPGGWRAVAALADGTEVDLALTLDADGAGWVTRSTTGGVLRSEIRSRAEAEGADACRVAVTFLVTDPPAEKRPQIGVRYRALYERLYDEDEAMMIARAEAIQRGPAALKERREVVLADGSTHSVPLYCPHQGLPLDAEPNEAGVITCPWHGYRFDARTGQAVDGHACGWTRR